MGYATDLDNFLATHPLTRPETQERRAAEEIGDPDIEATLDGDLVKRVKTSAIPIVVEPRKTATWD
jgi:hypothetical protein